MLLLLLSALALADGAPTVTSEATVQRSFAIVPRDTLPGLDLRVCAAQPPPPQVALPAEAAAMTFQIVLRRDRVRLVTVSEAEPGLEWLTPCLERELASFEWPWRRGKYDVTLEVQPE